MVKFGFEKWMTQDRITIQLLFMLFRPLNLILRSNICYFIYHSTCFFLFSVIHVWQTQVKTVFLGNYRVGKSITGCLSHILTWKTIDYHFEHFSCRKFYGQAMPYWNVWIRMKLNGQTRRWIEHCHLYENGSTGGPFRQQPPSSWFSYPFQFVKIQYCN